MMIRMVGGWVFLLVPAHPGRPGQRAVNWLLLLYLWFWNGGYSWPEPYFPTVASVPKLAQSLPPFYHCKSTTNKQTNKPVGFYGPIAPPVPNAASSECPKASITAWRRADSSIRICRRASCCCSSAIAGIAIWANFKIYLLLQFCSNRVQFFYNTQETQTQKIMDQNSEIRIVWFLRIFWNFQKGVARSLCGRSGPLWSRPN